MTNLFGSVTLVTVTSVTLVYEQIINKNIIFFKCYKKGDFVMEKINEVNVLTKECIVTSLLRLMETKNYANISITDITNLAGVSRMAYYRNYKCKDDILLNHLADQEKKLLVGINGEKANNFKEVIKMISNFFLENSAVIQAIYDAGLSANLSIMLSERVYSYFPVAIEKPDGKYAVPFYVGAMLTVFKFWFDNGMVESVDEISEVIYKLINNKNVMDYVVISQDSKNELPRK